MFKKLGYKPLVSEYYKRLEKNVDKLEKDAIIEKINILSRVDERIGFKTPQQPIKLGANTDKV